MQLDPPVYSSIARKYGLHVSLLERLFDLEAYESGVGQLCKTLLTENHRSHHLVSELDTPKQMFQCLLHFPLTRSWTFLLNCSTRISCLVKRGFLPQDQQTYQLSNLYVLMARKSKMKIPHLTTIPTRPLRLLRRWVRWSWCSIHSTRCSTGKTPCWWRVERSGCLCTGLL